MGGMIEDTQETERIEAAKSQSTPVAEPETQPLERPKVVRPQIGEDFIEQAMKAAGRALVKRLDKKGHGSFAGKHEILGILNEEFYELTKAVHEDRNGIQQVEAELLDIAVGAIFGVACIRAGVISK